MGTFRGQLSRGGFSGEELSGVGNYPWGIPIAEISMGTSVLFVVVTYPLMLRQTALEEIQKWSLILEHCAVSS